MVEGLARVQWHNLSGNQLKYANTFSPRISGRNTELKFESGQYDSVNSLHLN